MSKDERSSKESRLVALCGAQYESDLYYSTLYRVYCGSHCVLDASHDPDFQFHIKQALNIVLKVFIR